MSKERDEVKETIYNLIIHSDVMADSCSHKAMEMLIGGILAIPGVLIQAEDQNDPELLSIILPCPRNKPQTVGAYLHEHNWRKVVTNDYD